MISSGLILGRRECLIATSQKRHLMHVILFTVNYCLFANCDVSIRFNGKDDNIVLESKVKHAVILNLYFSYEVKALILSQ